MSTKTKELRTNADITLPCPVCGEECQPDYVTKLEKRKLKTQIDHVLMTPKHSLELICCNCGLESWLTLDADGYPIPYN